MIYSLLKVKFHFISSNSISVTILAYVLSLNVLRTSSGFFLNKSNNFSFGSITEIFNSSRSNIKVFDDFSKHTLH